PSPCASPGSERRGCVAISTPRPTVSTECEEAGLGSARKPRDRRGRAIAWYYLGKQHLAADAPDEFASDDLVDPVVGTLDEELRPDRRDQIDRRVLLEYDDQIYCRQ